MLDLTVLILTKNEEKNLRKCIESFKGVVKEFIIVDSYSTDGTIELCKKLNEEGNNVVVYQNKFIDYATQFNWGIENTKINTKWIMRMDADEELTDELVEELEKKLPNIDDGIAGIILKRRVYFMGKWIKHGGKYPELLLRIFRNGYAKCEQKLMDEHLILKEGKEAIFDKDIIDNNTKNLEWWTNKHNWYSNREVLDYEKNVINEQNDELLNNDKNKGQASKKRFLKNNFYYKLPLFFRAHCYFLYRYYIKLGFLDGKEGKIYHFLQAYWYRFLVDAKMYECKKTGNKIECQGDLK